MVDTNSVPPNRASANALRLLVGLESCVSVGELTGVSSAVSGLD